MGARGKVRRRANGQLATGRAKRLPAKPAPLFIDFADEPVAPISPAALSEALTIRNRHVPIHLAAVHELEESEGVDGLDEREKQIESEIGHALGAEIGEAACWRASLLGEYLTRTDPLYHDIREDGTVVVDEDLLTHAASTPLSVHPDERIEWPPAHQAE